MILQDRTAKQCQARAIECRQMAKISGSSEIAEKYRKMERRWLEVVAQAEDAAAYQVWIAPNS
jgi:hypothetical protein